MLSLTLVCSLTFHVVVKWWSSCLPAEKVSRVSVISSARYAQSTLAPRSIEKVVVVLVVVVVVVGFCC